MLWSRIVLSENANSGKLPKVLPAVGRSMLIMFFLLLVQVFPGGVRLEVGAFSGSIKDVAMRFLLARPLLVTFCAGYNEIGKRASCAYVYHSVLGLFVGFHLCIDSCCETFCLCGGELFLLFLSLLALY